MERTTLQPGKKIYFVSDAHLGVDGKMKSIDREKLLVKWLDEVKHDAQEIYILGDLFDFWFEYKHAAPRGYSRILGKLSELTDAGLPIYFFRGNHDMWVFGYLPQETGIILLEDVCRKEINGKKFLLAHGDGLGPGDHGYKALKKLFASKTCQWLFARLHPNFGLGIANYFSQSSRKHTKAKDEFISNEKEWLVTFCKEILEKEHIDNFVFGHRHLPLEIQVGENSKYTNLGDWIEFFTYGVFDGEKMELKEYKSVVSSQ